MTAAVASAAMALTQMNKATPALADAGNPMLISGFNTTAGGTTALVKTNGPTVAAMFVSNNNYDGIQASSTNSYGVNGGGVVGVLGGSGTSGGSGVLGTLIGQAIGQGVLGSCTSAIGVYGASGSNIGVLATSAGSHGVYGGSSAASVAGVFGTTTNSAGAGVLGTNDNGIAVQGSSVSSAALFGASGSGTAVVGRSTTGKAAEFFGDVEITGNFTASGMKSAAVKIADGSLRRMYCLESPVSYFEDLGTGQIADGHGSVTLDPMFVSTVDTADYMVFLTPDGDCQGLYVESKSKSGFAVRELMGGKSSIKFSYRIVAKRTGIANERFAPVKMSADPANPSASGPKPVVQREVEIPQLPDAPRVLPNLVPGGAR